MSFGALHRTRTRWAIASLLVMLCAGLFLRRNASAAIAMALLSPAEGTETNQSTGFSVRKETPEISEALIDFERYRDKKAWEKAFAAIGKVVDSKAGRLVRGTDGFFVPTSQKIREELLTLSPEGREAYRLFNDAKAQKLLRSALASDVDTTGGQTSAARPSGDDVGTLKKIVDLYFITSVGDRAADRLGDALFEAGDYPGAEDCWRLIVDSYPDTALSPVLLQTKRAIALAQGGQWDQFDAVRSLVRSRFAGQTARIGGKDTVATAILDRFAAMRNASVARTTQPADSLSADSASRPGSAPPVNLPTSDTPAWQIPLMNEGASTEMQNQLARFGWQGFATQFVNAIPAVAVDEHRMYVNWFGACFAADLKTGKLLWRTESFTDLPQQMQQMVMQGNFPAPQSYSVTAAGDRVLFVGRLAGRSNGEVQPTRLFCLNAENGKSIWKSDRGALSDWTFTGQPLIDGDTLYAIAHRSSSQEINLITIALATGEVRAKLPLGTPTVGTDFRGAAMGPVPMLLGYQGKIYVLTNNGAVVAVDPSAARVDWAFAFPTHIEQNQEFFNRYETTPPPPARGAILARGGTLYAKEQGGSALYALDLAGPSLKWKRPVDETVTLADVREHLLYLVGTDAQCIDSDSRMMQWSTRLSTGTGAIRPILTGDRIYVFGQRGVHDVRTASGDSGRMFRGSDRESAGGALWHTRDLLITVSNLSLTAYPVGQNAKP